MHDNAKTSKASKEIHSGALVMMVDDEPLEMEVIQLYLQDHGYEQFMPVADPTDAITLIIESRPNIVLLDIVMPEISGLDILKDIRSNPELDNIPIIVLTSTTDPTIKREALDLGANDILAKPLDASEVVLRINNTLAASEYYAGVGQGADAANDADANSNAASKKNTLVVGGQNNE